MKTKAPKGTLLIIGGAEDKGDVKNAPEIKAKNKLFTHYDILRALVPPDHRKKYSIELITSASEIPHVMGKTYIKTTINSAVTSAICRRMTSCIAT